MVKRSNKNVFEKLAKQRLQSRRLKKLKKYTKKRVVIPLIFIISLFIFMISMAIHSTYYISTDDAFVEGRLISVAPKVSGFVSKLYFDDNDYVKKGQLLIEIDDSDYKAKVHELQGSLVEAKGTKAMSVSDIQKSQADLEDVAKNLEFAKKDFERYSKLNQSGLCTKQQYDLALTNYKQAQQKQASKVAQLKSSKSKNLATMGNIEKYHGQLEKAMLDLSYTKIYAPQDGYISSRNVEIGNYVQVGQALTSLVPDELWIVANFKETQLTNMRKGQPVSIKIDTYPNKKFQGVVDSIQKSSGAKASLLPPENAVGSYVKVVQRIPVKIKFTQDIKSYNLAPGMSVVPKVKVK